MVGERSFRRGASESLRGTATSLFALSVALAASSACGGRADPALFTVEASPGTGGTLGGGGRSEGAHSAQGGGAVVTSSGGSGGIVTSGSGGTVAGSGGVTGPRDSGVLDANAGGTDSNDSRAPEASSGGTAGSWDAGARDASQDASGTSSGGTTHTGGSDAGSWPSPAGVEVRCIPVIPSAVNVDGTVVVGRRSTGPPAPAIWRNGSVTSLRCPVEFSTGASWASATSADGRVVVGTCRPSGPFPTQAFRYTEAGGFRFVGERNPSNTADSAAYDVSADGTVIVGRFYLPGGGGATASVWTEGGGFRTDVPLPAGSAVSGDGAIVIGSDIDPITNNTILYKWSSLSGLERLPHTFFIAGVSDISTDGRVVIGNGYDPRYTFGLRWDSLGLQILPCPTRGCPVSQTNRDGSVVVGTQTVWDPVHGTRDHATFLAAYGIHFAEAATLTNVSPDGRIFVGRTEGTPYVTPGFILALPESPSIAASDASSEDGGRDAGMTTISCSNVTTPDVFVSPPDSGSRASTDTGTVDTGPACEAGVFDPIGDNPNPGADIVDGAVYVTADSVDIRVTFAGNPYNNGAMNNIIQWCFGTPCTDTVDVMGQFPMVYVHGLKVGCGPLFFDDATNTVRVLLPRSSLQGDLSSYRVEDYGLTGGREAAPCAGSTSSMFVTALPPFPTQSLCPSDGGAR